MGPSVCRKKYKVLPRRWIITYSPESGWVGDMSDIKCDGNPGGRVFGLPLILLHQTVKTRETPPFKNQSICKR